MRISDWSSDVCSSDLPTIAWVAPQAPAGAWYTPKYDAFDPNGDTSVSDACTALAEISSRLEAAGVALDRQGIVGFSQGACLASHFIWRSTANMAFLGSLTGSLPGFRSEEHTSELQSLMRIQYAVL